MCCNVSAGILYREPIGLCQVSVFHKCQFAAEYRLLRPTLLALLARSPGSGRADGRSAANRCTTPRCGVGRTYCIEGAALFEGRSSARSILAHSRESTRLRSGRTKHGNQEPLGLYACTSSQSGRICLYFSFMACARLAGYTSQ